MVFLHFGTNDAFNQCVCLQYFRFPTVSSTPVYKHISVACQCDRQHWCMPNFWFLINALGSMNVGLMQICTPLSPSFEIFCPVITKIRYMYITMRACTLIVNVSVIIEPFYQYSRAYTNTAYFSLISSWRLLNQENAHTCVCDMENFYAMHMYLLFNHWIRAWWNHMGWCL